MKNIIIQVTYFLKVPMVNVILLSYIERKCFLKRNLATFLPLKLKLSRKFQSFSPIDGRIEILKIVEFPKVSIKMKNFKTFYKANILSDINQKQVCWKICKVSQVFSCVLGVYFSKFWVIGVFWAKLYSKISNICS